MNGRRSEVFHYTDEQVREHLRAALAILDDLAVPDDLRSIAFERVFNAISTKQIVVEQIAPGLGAMVVPRL